MFGCFRVTFPFISYLWGYSCSVSEYDGDIHFYDTYHAGNKEIFDQGTIRYLYDEMPESCYSHLCNMQDAVTYNQDTYAFTHLWKRVPSFIDLNRSPLSLETPEIAGNPKIELSYEESSIAVSIILPSKSCIPKKQMEALKTKTRVIEKKAIDSNRDFAAYVISLIWFVIKTLFSNTAISAISIDAFSSDMPSLCVASCKVARKAFEKINVDKADDAFYFISKCNINLNMDAKYCLHPLEGVSGNDLSTISTDSKRKRKTQHTSVFNQIIAIGDKQGGVSLSDIVDLIKLPIYQHWSFCLTGTPLEKLKDLLIEREWDTEIIRSVKDARAWNYYVTSKYYRDLDHYGDRWGSQSKDYLFSLSGTYHSSGGLMKYDWMNSDVIGNDAFTDAGFDFNDIPILACFLVDQDTGEMNLNGCNYLAVGASFDKVLQDFRQLQGLLRQAKSLDRRVTLYTRGEITAVDPALEGLPIMKYNEKTFITLYPACSLEGTDSYRPNALTPGGKVRKRLISARFHTASNKGSSRQTWNIQYGEHGRILDFDIYASSSKGSWKASFVASKDGKGFTLKTLETDTEKSGSSAITATTYYFD